jgi:hypothetical protein
VVFKLLNTNLEFHTDLNIKFGELETIMSWCREHIHSDWDLVILKEAGFEPGIYRFGFKDEKDYFTFLVWKK